MSHGVNGLVSATGILFKKFRRWAVAEVGLNSVNYYRAAISGLLRECTDEIRRDGSKLITIPLI